MKKYPLLTLAILGTILVFVFLLNQLEPVTSTEAEDCGLRPITTCEAVEAFFADQKPPCERRQDAHVRFTCNTLETIESDCQYPARLSNPENGCDNSDPACATIIKGAESCE